MNLEERINTENTYREVEEKHVSYIKFEPTHPDYGLDTSLKDPMPNAQEEYEEEEEEEDEYA
jgi:hypothetical protein